MNCRYCRAPLFHNFLDLGFAPPSNAYLTNADLSRPEKYYPLRVKVCDKCWLVQTEDYAQANELFSNDYAYFSSTSIGWLEHAERYVNHITKALNLSKKSFVIEIASNDGYLLKNFVSYGIPCLGIEPTDSTADVASKQGIPVLREFFGESLGHRLATQNNQADLIIGNNVYAHVPNIKDFTHGLKIALKSEGTITLEFPHLLNLIKFNQFDTIYHEHFSYLSLHAVNQIFTESGLRVFNVEKLQTHGGSLRVYGCHANDSRTAEISVSSLLKEEQEQGIKQIDTYNNFQTRADNVKNDLLAFLIEKKRKGKRVVAYGAAAKGNTLLNYAGVKPDLLPVVYDAAPSKQLKYMPGSHIPIMPPEQLAANKPDYILILPWNISQEVKHQLRTLVNQETKFFVAVPNLKEV